MNFEEELARVAVIRERLKELREVPELSARADELLKRCRVLSMRIGKKRRDLQ